MAPSPHTVADRVTGVGPARTQCCPATAVSFTGEGPGGGGTHGHPPEGVRRVMAKVVVPLVPGPPPRAAHARDTVTVPLKLQLGAAREEARVRVSSCSQPPSGAEGSAGQLAGVMDPSLDTLRGRPEEEANPATSTAYPGGNVFSRVTFRVE
jgi:hypothetical protein